MDVITRVIYSPKGGGMFGHDLASQLLKEGRGPDTIPRIVVDCVAHLRAHGAMDEPGIFRLAARSSDIAELRKRYNMAEWPELGADDDMHTVANTMKRYLRELPDPLLTADRFESVLAAVSVHTQR